MHRLILLLCAAGLCAAAAWGQRQPSFDDADATRAALAAALAERRAAGEREQEYAAAAERATDSAEKAARETAALAAKIQQAEAGIVAASARIAIIDEERAELREELGREQQPIVQLTAALQQFTRRPAALALVLPGSLEDTVYLRAIMHSAVPLVRERTSGLRDRIARGRELQREAEASAQLLKGEETTLAARRQQLAEAETRARLAARQSGNSANREAERALALSEQARDLEQLVGELDRAASLRERLAALEGPLLRPSQPGNAILAAPALAEEPAETLASDAPAPYILPVSGRTLTGFGAPLDAGLSKGLTLAPLPGAQVVAPAAGRVVFAGPYRGYGRIVIIEHSASWTSLVTGLARVDARVGSELVGGAPLGVAGPGAPQVALELRRDGEPVNPLDFTR